MINCFNSTTLEELKIKFNSLSKNVETEEQKQEIGISLIIEKYKQLFKVLNSLRKSSGLSVIEWKDIADLAEIKEKNNKLIKELEIQIEENNKSIEESKIIKAAEGATLNKEIKDSTDLVKIIIGEKQLKVEVAYTDEEKEKGLSNREFLDSDKGMLFIWDEPETIGIWMKETAIPLDIAFINEDLTVFAVHQGIPQSEEIIEHDDTVFVVEANINSGIKVGDELEFSPEKKGKMIVLDENGNNQMSLEGGERIVSRNATKVLIRKAKKASATNRDADYKSLGKYLFQELKNQDSREPEFVDK